MVETVLRPQRLLLTFAEAGDVLGCKSRKVRQLVDAGVLPSVYLGRLHRIVLSDIDAYVERLRTQRGGWQVSHEPPEDLRAPRVSGEGWP